MTKLQLYYKIIDFKEEKINWGSLSDVIDDYVKELKLANSVLQSLHQDLIEFRAMRFLNRDTKIGLDIAIEQVDRYMRNDSSPNL